ncbi:YHYH protein [Rhizobacter sp. OV335]|uniref:YHYH protein n=1 Tax=Rhizobacter sp. OV335 TaxID=1500264 RepID=UPI0013566035|nr:YHYH protein [Rhizobacter sp. OV335]
MGTSKVITTVPTDAGYLYLCSTANVSAGNPGNSAQGWISSDGTTWNLQTKSLYSVSGAVSWASTFTNAIANGFRKLDGNGLPSHTTGIYKITNETSPQAYQYDQNPNYILTNTIAWSGLNPNPTVNATPTCLSTGAVGVFLTGARMFAAFDAKGRDARAWEVTDACEGHPAPGGAYHYHSMPKCGLTADVTGQHSAVIGYAADGFAVYGMQGDAGKTIANADLDICHGHTDTSVTQYHYHTTETFPYTIGCYRGTPITSHN